MTEYRVQLPVFDGPLDLLLHLIEAQELDITVIALAQVTDQFLAYVQALDTPEPRVLADFLNVAAKLVLIKSRSLLPKPPALAQDDTDEEDVGEALARQLRELQRVKRAAALLQAREAAGLAVFAREVAPPTTTPGLGLEGVTLDSLVALVRQVMARLPEKPPPDAPVQPHTVSIEAKMEELRGRVRQGRLAFTVWLAEARSRYEVVAAFLALLELVKQRAAVARQEGTYGEIWVEGMREEG